MKRIFIEHYMFQAREVSSSGTAMPGRLSSVEATVWCYLQGPIWGRGLFPCSGVLAVTYTHLNGHSLGTHTKMPCVSDNGVQAPGIQVGQELVYI